MSNPQGIPVPPDTNGDVGQSHYMQWTNLAFAVYDKSSGALVYGPERGDILFTGLSGCNGGFDPIVLYDQFAARWLAAHVTFDNFVCIAISRTSDPTGAWCAYAFQPSPTALPDYPKFGVWPAQNAYIQVARQLSDTVGSLMVVGYERDRMLNCQTARMVSKDMSQYEPLPFLLPADADGAVAPLRGVPAPLVGMTTDFRNELQVWSARVDWDSAPSLSVVPATDLRPARYDANLCSFRACIPQPGTSVRLETLSNLLMHRVQYRNFGPWQTMVASHSVDAGGDHAGVRWYRLEKLGTGRWRVADQGTYAPDAAHRWMPSVAMDRSANLAIGYSAADDSSVYPSIRYTGRLATDAPGQMQAEGTISAGTGAQLHPGGRWGDYAAMAVDPVDDCTFYFTSEYLQTTSRMAWQTRVGAFRFPSCGQAPPGPCIVPRVVGLTLARAKARIRSRRCKIGRVRRVRSRRAGRVLRQSPRARAVLPRGSKVNLVVGRRK